MQHVVLAACIECMHGATLLHDDVIDSSSLRRNKTSYNNLWGNQISILMGDFLFSKSFQLIVEQNLTEILKILLKAASTLLEGEIMQLSITCNFMISKEEYLKVIKYKTASLFEATCNASSKLCNLSDTYKNALSNYGLFLGMAFQLINDMLDYSIEQKKLGRQIGNDLQCKKITLPVIIAYQEGSKIEQCLWHKIFENNESEHFLYEACQLIKKCKALDKTLVFARYYANKARNELNCFPNSTEKSALIYLSHYVTNVKLS